MKKLFTLIFFAIAGLVVADILNEQGQAVATGSPGEFDCTSCHTGNNVNSGTGSITIASPNMPNWQYVPGQVYQIDVTVSQTGAPLFGFGFEALRTSNNTNGGTFQITNAASTFLKTGFINGSNRTNVVHKKNGGLSNDTHTFSFNWTAPATNIGNIIFYSAGNAANKQGDTLGDFIYKTQQLITPSITGINEIQQADFSVYPNPATDFISIIFPESQTVTTYSILDISGKMVDQGKVLHSQAEYLSVKLPNSMKAGIYFIEVNNLGDYKRQKFVKLKN